MSSVIRNFAALSNQGRDLLDPVEHRTIIEMIRGILNSFEFKKLDGVIKQFYQHLNSKDPLYANSGVDFLENVLEDVYAIYSNMLAQPLSFADFKSQLVPTLGFVELFRRIVLNRYLYDQLKDGSGQVTAGTHNVFLSHEWRLSETYQNPVALSFASAVATELDFIRLGWNGNTQPFPTIFTAESLSHNRPALPVAFSVSDDLVSTLDTAVPVDLPIVSNDFTIELWYSGAPATVTELISLTNGSDIFKALVKPNRTIEFHLNGMAIITSPAPSDDGRVRVSVEGSSYVTLTVADQMSRLMVRERFIPNFNHPFDLLTVTGPFRGIYGTGFGLRDVSIYHGYEAFVLPDEIVVPLGYRLLIDKNGSYLQDRDGVPLMDVDVEPGADVNGNFVYLTDSDGAFLMDENGVYYTAPADTFDLIIDRTDDATVIDRDGAQLIEPGRAS